MSSLWNLIWRRRGDTYRTIVVAVLIALGVRTFAYEPFNIPSGSMKPTLLIGDYLFVSKFSYGYSRYSFPWSFPPFEGRILGSEPDRGDVVVFKTPADNKTDFIKRVVGLPGDRVQVRQGHLFINGEEVPREEIGKADETCFAEGSIRPYTVYRETLPGGHQHLIWECSDTMGSRDANDTRTNTQDNTIEYVVPAGHYFMMGDNRDNSNDSRADVGYVGAENLIGRAQFIFFSHDDSAAWWEVWRWPEAIRWSRLGQGIE